MWMKYFDEWKVNRIHSDPEILAGTVVFRGTRISVAMIGKLAKISKPEEILKDYPDLLPLDVTFARWWLNTNG